MKKLPILFLGFIFGALTIGVFFTVKANAVDLIVYNAKVTTLNSEQSNATAIAVKDGQFIAVGADKDILALKEKTTTVIDAHGRRMIPGLNDSHLHATRGGRFYNMELRWEGVNSLEKALQMIKEQAARTPKGQWVRVIGGWSPYQFEERRMPSMKELNEAAPDTPLFILYLYSQGFLNKAGMEALGIDKNTQPPWGSEYVKDEKGELTGLLIADPNPMILYKTISALPAMNSEEQINSTQHFYRDLVSKGLTSVIDAGGGGHYFPNDYRATQILAERGDVPLRISYYLFPQTAHKEYMDFEQWIKNNKVDQNGNAFLPNGYRLKGGGEFLVWSAGDYENFMSPRPDLKEEYHTELTNVTELLVKNDWPLRIHATYDQSIGKILDVFEDVNKRHPFKNIRWAFDHAETVKDTNLKRIKALGGGIAIQDRMAFAGEAFVERYGAEAAKYAPPIRKMLDMDIPVGAGTDGTRVSSYDPWVSLYWLTSGKTVGGLQLFASDNILSREEALRLYTRGSAWFSREEHLKGQIAAGQYADFILLTDDYMTIKEDAIKDIRSVLTIVGGKVKYGAAEYSGLIKPLPKALPIWSPVNYYQVK